MSLAAVAAIAALASAGSAQAAATKPVVTTGAASSLTQTGATLGASVNPAGAATTYHFQYGTTAAYGSATADAPAGGGTTAKKVSALLTNLTAATTYHYRIIATNSVGTSVGADKTFATKKQPLGFTLTADPNPATFAGPVTLVGTLTGSDNANRGVVLQQKAFPYTAGWANLGNPQVTSSTGAFSFPVLSLTANTQFRVLTTGSNAVASAIVLAGSAVQVHIAVSSTKPRARSTVRFAGTVRPREDGALYAVQKQKGTAWVTIRGSSLRPYSSDASRYAIHVKIAHSGTYRVYVGVADGAHVSSSSASVTLQVRPRR